MRYPIAIAFALIVAFVGSVAAHGATDAAVSGLVNIELKDVPVRQAIDSLFEGRGLKYYIQPGVTGRIVELKLKGIAFDEALKALGDAAGFGFRIEDGAYIIGPATAQAGTTGRQPVQTQPASPPRSVTVVGAGPTPQPASPAQPIIVNNVIPTPSQGGCAGLPTYPAPYYYGAWSPVVNLNSGPYVFGRFVQPPPPPGWVSPDVERFLRFEWSVPTRPGFAAPYPYFYP